MKLFSMLAGAALFVGAGAAVAQPAQGRGAELTRAQAAARADQTFARIDADRDGRVTREEMRASRQARRAQRAERRGEAQGGQRVERAFARFDADRNGQISREEFAAARQQRQGQRGQARGNRFGMGAQLFASQGFVTQVQWRENALQRFDRMDANRDGTVTRDERRQARQQMRAQRQG